MARTAELSFSRTTYFMPALYKEVKFKKFIQETHEDEKMSTQIFKF